MFCLLYKYFQFQYFLFRFLTCGLSSSFVNAVRQHQINNVVETVASVAYCYCFTVLEDKGDNPVVETVASVAYCYCFTVLEDKGDNPVVETVAILLLIAIASLQMQ
jgi:uncharacterized protein (UPF0297 family)